VNLQNWKDQAKAHWKEFQPTRFQQLQAAGKLDEALTQAAEQTYRETSELENSGFQPDEAFQMVRERYLFPREEGTTPASETGNPTTAEMLAAASRGQRSMPL
jgi:hypothetical protein